MASLFGRGFDSLQVHDDYFKPLIFQRFFYISLFVKTATYLGEKRYVAVFI